MCRTNWRGWRDFGTGALGDMGCHIIDHPVWALDLGTPTSVEATATLDGSLIDGKAELRDVSDRGDHHLRVPRTRPEAPVRMTWYEGGLMPPTPAEMPAGPALAGQRRFVRRQQGKDVPLVARRHAPAPAGGD